jgi:hypothetical protein
MSPKPSMIRGLYNIFLHLWFYFWSNASDRCKRMFVLSSLYARLMQCSEDDLDELKALNENLDLTRDTRALRTPALFSTWVWGRTLPLDRVDMERVDSYVTRLVKKTPCWLWYADQETRRRDIQDLILYCVYRKTQPEG